MKTAGIILFCFILFNFGDVLHWLPVQFDGERERGKEMRLSYIAIYARVCSNTHVAVATATGKGWRVDPAAAARTGTSAVDRSTVVVG